MDRAELVLINGAEPEVLDPAMITAQATGRVGYAVYEGLTAFDLKASRCPGVAERWEMSPDGLHYTFHLRPNAVLEQWRAGHQRRFRLRLAPHARCRRPPPSTPRSSTT